MKTKKMKPKIIKNRRMMKKAMARKTKSKMQKLMAMKTRTTTVRRTMPEPPSCFKYNDRAAINKSEIFIKSLLNTYLQY